MPSSDALRIGIVQPDDPPRGGLGRSLITLATLLRARDVAVEVLPVHAPRVLRRLPGSHVLAGTRGLARLIRDQRITHLVFPVGPGSVRSVPQVQGVRTIALVHHTYEQQSREVPGQGWKELLVPGERKLLRKANRVVCTAECTAEALRESGVPAEKIYLVPHAVDLRPWDQAVHKRPGLCVCVARLDARKNVQAVVRAWSRVRERVAGAELIIVGDGILRTRIDAQIAGDPSILRTSSLSQEALRHLTATAEVALCPAHLEGFGLACAEAMAAGTAVVANDAPGLRSLIRHGETGLLADADDADAWAAAVVRLLRDAGFRQSIVQAAKTEVLRRFDPVGSLNAYIEALTSP